MTCDTCQHKNSKTENHENYKLVTKHGVHFMWYPSTFSQSRLGNINSSNVPTF